MKDIKNTFLTKTIPDFLSWEYDMPYIKFVFDKDTLKSFNNSLIKEDLSYYKGLKSIEYLCDIHKQWLSGEDEIYIVVHDSNRFFSLLEKLIQTYPKKKDNHKLLDSDNFIRSIWLRMGPSDIDHVEEFLERQLTFLNNSSVVPKYRELEDIGNSEVLAYRVHENDDWFETNQNIVFSVRKYDGDIFDGNKDYDFPAIHFALSRENGKPTCFIYGIQSINGLHDEDVKKDIQPIRKSLRNKYVSPDFVIGLSLFLDFLYDNKIEDIEVPILQVFNYPYHEHLSSSIYDNYSGYAEEDREEIERLYEKGDRSDKVLDYMHTKGMVSRFVDKQDLISQNKTERFYNTFLELIRRYPCIELVSEPFIHSENMKIHLNGKIDLFSNLNTKKRTY